jgi:hypothetical protein
MSRAVKIGGWAIRDFKQIEHFFLINYPPRPGSAKQPNPSRKPGSNAISRKKPGLGSKVSYLRVYRGIWAIAAGKRPPKISSEKEAHLDLPW